MRATSAQPSVKKKKTIMYNATGKDIYLFKDMNSPRAHFCALSLERESPVDCFKTTCSCPAKSTNTSEIASFRISRCPWLLIAPHAPVTTLGLIQDTVAQKDFVEKRSAKKGGRKRKRKKKSDVDCRA